jgi:hypothetical protein
MESVEKVGVEIGAFKIYEGGITTFSKKYVKRKHKKHYIYTRKIRQIKARD